jgi:hypothetical protein
MYIDVMTPFPPKEYLFNNSSAGESLIGASSAQTIQNKGCRKENMYFYSSQGVAILKYKL